MESRSNETECQESYISNQDSLANLKYINNIFDKSLKSMWHGGDAKSRQNVSFI